MYNISSNLKKINAQNVHQQLNFQKLKWVEKIIKITRVAKVTKGGKNFSFRAIVAIGDCKGTFGVGVAKAEDIVNAIKKAKKNGQKHLIQISITKSSSIEHVVESRFKACKVIIKPAAEGTGVIAGGSVKSVLEVAGIKNVTAKQLGSKNLLNNARAAMSCLKNL